MKTFKQHITETNKIQLFHGAQERQKSLSLPKRFIHQRSADGHAVYLTTHKGEAETYGPHVHQVEFDAGEHELINMDRTLTRQHSNVKAILKTLAPEVFEKNTNNPDRQAQPHDVIHHLQKKHGEIEASKILSDSGIKGTVGGSLFERNGKTLTSKAYASYRPDRDIKVVSKDPEK